jgi:hypothetical protein
MSDTTLFGAAAVAEHVAANLLKNKVHGLDAKTAGAISGAFAGFAAVLRSVATGDVDMTDLSVLDEKIVDAITENLVDRHPPKSEPHA